MTIWTSGWRLGADLRLNYTFCRNYEAVGIIVAGDMLTGAGHEDDSGGIRRGEDVCHVNLGLCLGDDASDAVGVSVEGELIANFKVAEARKDGVGVADKESFIGVFRVGASDYLWNGDFGADFIDVVYRGGEVDGWGYETGGAVGVGGGGLEAVVGVKGREKKTGEEKESPSEGKIGAIDAKRRFVPINSHCYYYSIRVMRRA